MPSHLVHRAAAVAGAAALIVLGAAALTAQAASAAAHSPTAQVWITTPDHAQLLHDAGTVSFGTAAPKYETVTIDPSRRYQTMTGLRRVAYRLVSDGPDTPAAPRAKRHDA